MEYNLEQFYQDLAELNLSLTEGQVQKFVRYYEILMEWNKKMNLTAIVEFEEVLKKHFIDSLSVLSLKEIHLEGRCSLADIGTGAGFPGIPLKILYEDMEVLLLDSLRKRTGFLNEVISELGLKSIQVVHGRAEEVSRDSAYRESFDVVVSRAVADLPVLLEYCMPFVKQGGYFVAYKSLEIEDELARSGRAVDLLGGKVQECNRFFLPHSEIGRTLISVRRVKPCPHQYPRNYGMMKKHPL